MYEQKDYRKKWGELEKATDNLNKEIFGLRCKIEGIRAEIADIPYAGYHEREKHLMELEERLSEIKVLVTEEDLQIRIPKEFASITSVYGVEEFDPVNVIRVMFNLSATVQRAEAEILPGDETSYSEKGICGSLIDAIFEFEVAFLNYID